MSSRTLGRQHGALPPVIPKYDWPELAFRNQIEQNARSCSPINRLNELSSLRKPTVIIVDDDSSVRRALRLRLTVAGFRVRMFDSAQNFLAGKLPYMNTCLLLDIYMPGMTGVELWRHLAAVGRQIPTVLMSDRDDEETKALARRATGVPCQFKPFDQSSLVRAIKKAIDRPQTLKARSSTGEKERL